MSERVIFIDPSGRGGIGQYTFCLAREMVRLGVEVTVMTSTDWEFQDQSSGIQPCLCFNGYRTRPWIVRREFQRIAKNGALAVHWQAATHPFLLRFLQSCSCKKLGGLPWVFTVHNVLSHDMKRLDRIAHKLLYDQMDGLIFHGRTSRDRFEQIFSLKSRRWATIPHGEYAFHFEQQPAPGPNLDAKNILFFGNIRPYKGLVYLLRAFQLVRKQIPGARLLIVGNPLEDFTHYQKEIDLLGMEKDVEVQLRYVPNNEVREVLSRATVVALPYTDIYQSGVLLLAYGAGIPVVASRVGDLGDAVEDGGTGFLVPPKDVPALREALLAILSNPEQCRQMGRRAKELADTEYNWNRIAKRTIEFYRTLRNVST
ncbi:MAG: glycosyltransferase family 4 protein [bacterium]